MYTLSVVVPIFNASEFIEQFVIQLSESLQSLPVPSEIILVDDCSTDNTYTIAGSVLAGIGIPSSIYSTDSNRGQYYATVLGLCRAQGAILLTMDCDFSPSPDIISEIWSQLNLLPYSIIYLEFERPRTWLRKLGTKLFNAVIKMLTKKKLGHREGSSFRIIDRALFDKVRTVITITATLDVLLMRKASDISFISVKADVRDLSSHGLFRLFGYFITLLISVVSISLKHGQRISTDKYTGKSSHFSR